MICVYPGSFDPPTLGHIDIIKRASKIYEKVYVVVFTNINKKHAYTSESREKMLKLCTEDLPNVCVDRYSGLLCEYMKEKNCSIILKGLRNASDFEYELPMSTINNMLSSNIETIFLISDPKYMHISSSMIRELIKYKADISKFVHENILEYLNKGEE